MSSKVTGDAQSDAGPGGDKNQALPTEMVDNSAAEAGALTVAENPAGGGIRDGEIRIGAGGGGVRTGAADRDDGRGRARRGRRIG